MAIPIKPIIELLKPFAKQAAEAAATLVVEEGIKKIFEKRSEEQAKEIKSIYCFCSYILYGFPLHPLYLHCEFAGI